MDYETNKDVLQLVQEKRPMANTNTIQYRENTYELGWPNAA